MSKKTKKNSKIKLWLHGASGRMGQAIQKELPKEPALFQLMGGSDHKFEGDPFYQGQKVDVEKLAHCINHTELVIDFSSPEANEMLLDAFAEGDCTAKSVLIGTTGIPDETLVRWRSLAEANKLQLMIAPNTSLGIALLIRAALNALPLTSKSGFDIEIVETHHREKKDAPSGTAKLIADTLAKNLGSARVVTHRQGKRGNNEIGVHSIRGGGAFGEHQIRFLSEHEEISFTHVAYSRHLFAQGALMLSKWLVEQKAGVYSVMDVL